MEPRTLKDHDAIEQLPDIERISTQISNDMMAAERAKSAARGAEVQHNLTFWEAFKRYPRAVLFPILLSMAIIMEGYDTALLGSFFAYPTFRQKFGERLPDGSYQLTASWQSGLQAAVQVGEIIGLHIAGSFADKFGYRIAMLGASALMIGAIFIMFFAQNIYMLFAGEIVCGLPWGAYQALTLAYAVDIAPMALRPLLTSFVNMCWVIGQLISMGVLRAFLPMTDDWGWRIPYALQWFWPLPVIVAVILAPESPTWLIRGGRDDDARVAMRMLITGKSGITEEEMEDQFNQTKQTVEEEQQNKLSTSYKSCFTGTDRRRTEIASMAWAIQIGSGVWFGGSVVYFLEQAGFDSSKAFNLGLGNQSIALAGTMAAWWFMNHIGRRSLYLWGLAIMFTVLVIVGALGIPEPTETIGYISAVLLYLFTFTYDITVGPVCYTLVSEIGSTTRRVKTVAIARNTYNLLSIAANFLNNPILNPSAWNLRGKGGFIWCGFALASWIYTYYRIPETKGLLPDELNDLFDQRLPAREFSRAKVRPIEERARLRALQLGADLAEEVEVHVTEKGVSMDTIDTVIPSGTITLDENHEMSEIQGEQGKKEDGKSAA